MAIIDKIQLSGIVYTIGNETTTAVTSASTDNEIPTAKAVYDAIPQGGGGESCTVDSTTMFYTFNDRYSNDALDMRARYVVLDYGQHKTETPDVTIEVNFRDINYNTYVHQNISLNYSTSSYTLGDISQAEYIDVTYDSTIEDFKIAVATAYTSTVFISYITFWNGNIKVPFYTISSGSPCTAIENDIPTAISELGNSMLKGLKEVIISSQQDAISIDTEKLGGNRNLTKIKLDEIDGSNSTLKPDIYVGLGTSGWTEINLSQQCYIDSLKATKYRVTYNYSEFDANSMGLQLVVEYGGNEIYDYVIFNETQQPSLQTQDVFSAATVDWNDSTKELVITYPETIEWYGSQEPVNISKIYSNSCQFGQAITKLESYGEAKQALKPYVQETRAALGGKVDTSAFTAHTADTVIHVTSDEKAAWNGKQDALVSGTNIKTINNESILGEGNITIQGGSGGGKAIEAGRGISITTGETADTVSFSLPISGGGSSNLSVVGGINTSASFNYSFVFGADLNQQGGSCCVLFGDSCNSNGSYTFAGGWLSEAKREGGFAYGMYVFAKNIWEHSVGLYNNSVSASTTFGNSGNTLFSVGNGKSNSERHNAFEIRQNGDIYIADTNDTSTSNWYEKPMIKLQDKFTEINNTIGDIETLLASI